MAQGRVISPTTQLRSHQPVEINIILEMYNLGGTKYHTNFFSNSMFLALVSFLLISAAGPGKGPPKALVGKAPLPAKRLLKLLYLCN